MRLTTRLALVLLLGAGLASAALAAPPAKPASPRALSLDEQDEALGAGDPGSGRVRVLVAPRDPAIGPADALVTIVVFSDFQCPFCARARATMDDLRAAYPADVRLVFKHNPLPHHKDAYLAAEASLAAHAQGKFWAMHDALFANQQALDRASIEGYADGLGLDLGRFRDALDRHAFQDAIDEDIAYAAKKGARGTPTFFVNGRIVRGAQPLAAFRAAVDAELAAVRELAARRHLSAPAVYAELMKAAVPAGAPPPPPPSSPPAPQLDPARIYNVPVGASPQRGPAGAKLTIVEITDFQCPFCARAEATLDDLRKKYGEDLRIVHKDNPLPSHPDAQLAAEAARAAGAQGKFWEMHDKLFADQRALDRQALELHAVELGLDLARFQAALDKGTFRAAVRADAELAARLGARGTPQFFVNGRPLRGAQPLDAFVKLCDEELARARALARKGVPARRLYDELVKDGLTRVDAPASPDADTVHGVPILAGNPAVGPARARVTLVVFTDFQCPYCARATATVEELRRRYPRDLRVVFKQLPLPMHPDAELAARAALAAHAQGKFLAMHDRLFAHQDALGRAALSSYAAELGLDVAKFDAAVDATQPALRAGAQAAGGAADPVGRVIEADGEAARTLGLTGTPSFFVNGRKLVGARPVEDFARLVDEELARKR